MTGASYEYVGGDPVNGTDPSGLNPFTTWIANHGGHQLASFGAGAANFAGHAISSTVDLAIKAADGGPYQPTAPPLNVPNPYPCESSFYTAGGVTAGIAGFFVDPEADVPEATGTVWDWITATQPAYEGTVLPRSFILNVGEGTDFWVAPNASEHILERIGNVAPTLGPIQTQNMLSSLRAAVEAAAQRGIAYNQITDFGGWEMIFGPPRPGEAFPVLYHALYRG